MRSLGCVSALPAWEVAYYQWDQARDRASDVHFPAEVTPPPSMAEEAKPLLPTETEDDLATPPRLQSLNRSLNRSLYLLTERQNPHTGERRWTLPSVPYTALPFAQIPPRMAAQAAVKCSFGEHLDVHPLGGAPIAYHRYDYSQQYITASGTEKVGAKLFLFHGLYCGGVVDVSGARDCVDWGWMTREQVMERVEDDQLKGVLLDVMKEDIDYAEGISQEELHRRRDAVHQYRKQPTPAAASHLKRHKRSRSKLQYQFDR